MSNQVLSPGELAIGQFITVLGFRADEDDDWDDEDGPVVMIRPQQDLRGVIFEVKSIDLPYILGYTLSGNRHVLDTREFIFKEVKHEFVQAVRGATGPTTTGVTLEGLAEKHNALAIEVVNRFGAVAKILTDHKPPAPPRFMPKTFIDWLMAATFVAILLTSISIKAIFR